MNATVAVAVSGGRDSMALLHCTAHAAQEAGMAVQALHVHHGLQAQADEWAAFVERVCARWAAKGLPIGFSMQRLDGKPQRGRSVEAWARAGRYAALDDMARETGCQVVMLAQHRGDQAETFLLQALRGAGPAGLASMPRSAERDGITWLRPWLEQPRSAIEAYVRSHRIRYIDDASNADARFARNRLRLQVLPALNKAFPDAEASLAAAARQAAAARALIAEVAREDLATLVKDDSLVLEPWACLSAARRREALRSWLSAVANNGVPESLLDRLQRELPASAPARWPLGEMELRRYRGRLRIERATSAADSTLPRDAGIACTGEYAVPGTTGMLRVTRERESGMPLALLRGARWQARAGAERFQRAPDTPPRSLKHQFQAAGVPAWSRTAPLLIAADGMLLFVPGLGTDARALAIAGSPRVRLVWSLDR